MASPELYLRYPDLGALRADHEANLRRARAFVVGATGCEERGACVVVIQHPESGAEFRLPAEVVYVKPDEPGLGVGVSFSDRSLLQQLAAFIDEPQLEVVEEPAAELEVVEEPAAELEVVEEPAGELEEVTDDDGDDAAEGARGDAASQHLHERVRKLSMPEQQRMARNGNLSERIMLERAYGPAVWEALLQNTRLTQPEVARIAKKGTLPKPLLELIAANGAWVGSPEVQRALLANPRTGASVVTRVLRALPRGDLTRVPQQTAYPMATRLAAKKMLNDD